MKKRISRMKTRGNEQGFSLVEVLTVLAIIAILTAASLPAFQSLVLASNLTQGGQTLMEQINLARQIASTRNVTIEVRLLQWPTVPAVAGGFGYNAVQLFRPPTGNETPDAGSNGMMAVSPPVRLPQSVVISQDSSNYSQLLSLISSRNGSGAAVSSTPMTAAAGQVYYAAFHITPSGLVQVMNGAIPVHVATMAGLYLSVVPVTYGNQSSLPGSQGAPSNYVLVQVNPNTGTTQVYRP